MIYRPHQAQPSTPPRILLLETEWVTRGSCTGGYFVIDAVWPSIIRLGFYPIFEVFATDGCSRTHKDATNCSQR